MFQFIIIIILIGISVGQKCEKEIENTIFVNGSNELRSLIIWFPANIGAQNKYDQCSNTTGQRLERNCSGESGTVKWIEYNKSEKYINCTQLGKCEEEPLKHLILRNDFSFENYLNKWQSTEVGDVGKLEKPCYVKKILLTRECKYNEIYHKAEWKKSDKENNLICDKEEDSDQNQNETSNQENLSTLKPDVRLDKCEKEPFEHYYRKKGNVLEKYLNKWLPTEPGKDGYLEKPCYLKSGLLTRKCKNNPTEYKTEWEKSDEEKKGNLTCWEEEYSEEKQNETSNQENLFTLIQDLSDLKLNKTKANVAINEAITLLKNEKENTTTDHINVIHDIIKVIVDQDQKENRQLVPDILNLTNTLMETKPEIIKDSKNASQIFPLIDMYLNKMAKQLVPTDKCDSINDGIYKTTVSSASLFYINPLCSNISGVAIFNSRKSSSSSSIKRREYDEHSKNYYYFIYLNQSLNELLEESDLKIATFFPLKLWNSIIETTGSKNDTILKIMLFKNDVLFVNQTAMEQKPIKSVLEITVIDYKEKLPSDLPFIFNNLNRKKYGKSDCGFWNKTTWITTGINTSHIINSLNEHRLLCNTSHLTPFSALLNLDLADTLDDIALDMISVLGCGLSLFGLICIWLTAVCFPKWREHSTNKVLLNICFVLTLIMIFFLLLNMPDFKTEILDIGNYTNCLIMGAFLQYIVLVLFMWMLFIAVVQYHRLVKNYDCDMGGHFIRKCFLLSWGLPLIPTLLVAHFQPNAYMPNNKNKADNNAICYPSGYGFYLGVMLPMVIIIVANIGIFAKIILRLLQSNIDFKNLRTRKQKLRQLYISILLFFLLGISWIFGILAHLENSTVFSYMFCLTSTLQGFVIFIHFIVLNKSTRSTWWNLICGIENSQTSNRRR